MIRLKNRFKELIMVAGMFIGLLLTGCDLDVIPPDTISPESFWTSEADAVAFLNTIYNSANTKPEIHLFTDTYSDDVYNRHSHEGAGYLFVQNGLSAGSDMSTFNWNFFTIRMTNILLRDIEQVPMDEGLKERMKMEARFWRAWDYLFKTITWGKVPLAGDEVFPYDEPAIPRNSQSEVFDYIIQEAKACYDVLPGSYDASNYGRVTKWAARALQAQAELFSGRYADAAATAKDIIQHGGFSLKTVNEILDPKEYEEMDQFIDWTAMDIDKDVFMKGVYSYGAVWTQADNNPEYILTRQYMDAKGFTDNRRYQYIRPNQCATDGWSSITPTQNLVDAYWTADGKTFTPPAQETRVRNFTAMDEEWIASDQSVIEWTDRKIAANTLKDYPYMQEFRNRDSRLYASILFPYKSWNQTEQGEFTYRFRHRSSPNEQNNESKTGFGWRKLSALTNCSTSQYETDLDFPVLRFAEILLIYAEATTEATGYDATVAAELNKLRERAGMPDVPVSFASKADALAFIRQERRIELAGEGRRSQDITRYEEQYWIDHMGDVPVTAPNGDRVLTMKWNNRMRLKPVPVGAMDLNPALQGDQNPGY